MGSTGSRRREDRRIGLRVARVEGLGLDEVIGAFVKLKRAGSNWRGLCPFHDDRRPSLQVNARKGIWKCFACGEGGRSAVGFVADFLGVSFRDGLEACERKFGLTIPGRGEFGERELRELERAVVKSTRQDGAGTDVVMRLYADEMIEMIRTFKFQSVDRWRVLDGMVEWIWAEFDAVAFRSRREFDGFRRWAERVLAYVEWRTCAALADWIGGTK